MVEEIVYMTTETEENVPENPKHYNSKTIEPWDYIIANELDYLEGNIIKYITRHKDKGRKKDIDKLIKYAEKLRDNYEILYGGLDN